MDKSEKGRLSEPSGTIGDQETLAWGDINEIGRLWPARRFDTCSGTETPMQWRSRLSRCSGARQEGSRIIQSLRRSSRVTWRKLVATQIWCVAVLNGAVQASPR